MHSGNERRIIMKSILPWILSLILVFVAVDSMAAEWWYFAGDNEELYGTWINMDYDSNIPSQKVVFNSDGTGGGSSSVDFDLSWKIRYLLTGKWTDSEGNIMYKSHWVGTGRSQGFSLLKISNSGTTLEYTYLKNEYPEEIDPKHTHYRKYTRK
jgi:hypothetical protein